MVSGINRGSNLGWDVIVSGTVGAAVQGFVRGYPTIAISVGSVQSPRYDLAARVVAALARRLCDAPAVSPPYFLNVNVPNEPASRIAGVQVTQLGGRAYGESVRTEEAFGQRRYWISRNRPVLEGGEGSDIAAHRANHITVTPMGMAFSATEERRSAVRGLVDGIGVGISAGAGADEGLAPAAAVAGVAPVAPAAG